MLSTLLVVGVISHLWCAARLVGIAHHSFYSEELVHDDEMRLQYGEEYLECDPDSDKDEVEDLIPNLEDFAHDEIEDPEDTNELIVDSGKSDEDDYE